MKAVRLRGESSQGIVCRPRAVTADLAAARAEGVDFAGLLDGVLPLVPRLWAGPFDVATVLALAQGTETVSGRGLHLREGVVVRPAVERFSAELGGRTIAKVVRDAYLTRKGAAEYE